MPMHSALPRILQAAQTLSWAMQSCFQSFRHESKAGTVFCQLTPGAAGVRVQQLQHKQGALPWAHGHDRTMPLCSRRSQGSPAQLKWHWMLLTGHCTTPRAQKMFCRLSIKELHSSLGLAANADAPQSGRSRDGISYDTFNTH